MTAALTWSSVHKRYGDRVALDDVSVELAAGKITAVVGENGAGKTTLLEVAYGMTASDAGRLRIGEVDVLAHSPAAAIDLGVGMVHQHFMLVPTLSVLENIVLGREPTTRGVLSLSAARRELSKLCERLDFAIDLSQTVGELAVGQQQRVEILKVLWRGAKVLLLDEPTAVLTPQQAQELFAMLRTLVDAGSTVALVTHRLNEVVDFADHIVVMRRGRVVSTLERGASAEQIARAMMGRDATPPAARAPRKASTEVALRVEHLTVMGDAKTTAVDDLSLSVCAGQALGIAGVQGNGQTELIEALAGLRAVHQGVVKLGEVNLAGVSPQRRLAMGLAHIPEDRLRRGLVAGMSVEENLLLGRQWEFTNALGLDRKRLRAFCLDLLAEHDVVPADPLMLASALSGGNQQKVVVAREQSRKNIRVMLCAEPTRGVDVGAAARIVEQLLRVKEGGAAMVCVSSDLGELRTLCDQVAVLFRGKLVCLLPTSEATDDELGLWMTGAKTAEPSP